MNITQECGNYSQITASTQVANAAGATTGTAGCLLGIFVSAASATPTITVYDSLATTTSVKIIDTFTPVAATFYPIHAKYSTGCYVAISGTVSCTPIFANVVGGP